jgi:cytochrome bd ubiquinol oxidase subunit II
VQNETKDHGTSKGNVDDQFSFCTSDSDPSYSLTVYDAASSPHALRVSFIANIVGMIGVLIYTTYVHRTFSGKIQLRDHSY